MFPKIWLSSALLLSALNTAAAKTYPYFNITSIYFVGGGYHGYGVLYLNITDPATKTHIVCDFSWTVDHTDDQGHPIKGGLPPVDWKTCQDNTFSVRFNVYNSQLDWSIGIRHQYAGSGHAFAKSNGSQCVTRLGSANFNAYSTPGVTISENEHSGGDGTQSAHTAVNLESSVYSTCTGCASNALGSC